MRRRFGPILDRLEGRSLMTAPPVAVNGSLIVITPPLASGNTVEIHHDAILPVFDVTVNSVLTPVSDAGIGGVFFNGLADIGGGDTFSNDTNLLGIEYSSLAGGDTFRGGTNQDYAFLFGDGNSFDVQVGCFGVAYTHGGRDTIGSNVTFVFP